MISLPNPFRLPADSVDLVVVGMGSAGLMAGEFAARDLGLRVVGVDRSRLGGDCLWTGCVPSKTLIASARAAHAVRHADRYAIGAQPPVVDLVDVWRRIAAVQIEIAGTDDSPDRFRELGVELVRGVARVTGAHEVTVGDRVIRTRYILVCTGSRPRIPPIDGIDGVDVLHPDNLFDIVRPPDSLIVVGGGPVGCELAQALNRLGVAVTLVERGPRLLPNDHAPHSELLHEILLDEGVDVRVDADVVKVRKGGDGVTAWISRSTPDAARITAQGLLIATGRTPNVHDLGLEGLGVEIADTGITVDDRSRTAVPTIYAVGDATTRPHFTHAAAYDAAMALRDMFLPGAGRQPGLVPWCTFTDPEVAHVGLTQQQAIDAHGARRVALHRRTLEHSDRARTDGTTDGEIAIITARGRIVGAHAICAHAGDLIHELALAIHAGMKLSDVAQMMHVYPTLATTIGQIAADDSFSLAHRLRHLAKIGRLNARRGPFSGRSSRRRR